MVGVVVGSPSGRNGSKVVSICWDNGTIGMYSYPGSVRTNELHLGSVVLFRPINGACIVTSSGERVYLDKKPLDPTPDIEFPDIDRMVELARQCMAKIKRDNP